MSLESYGSAPDVVIIIIYFAQHSTYRWRHLVKATEVTAGLAESNGSLPPGRWLKSHMQADCL